MIFRPSLQLTQKGYQSVVGNLGAPFYWKRDLRTNYLEIPFDVLRTFKFNQTSCFYIGTGPVAVVSIDNNQQLHTQISTDNSIFKNNLDRRFDFGWDFNIEVQSCKMFFNASYNHGITNVVKGKNQTLKNGSLALSVGYFIR